MAEINGKLCIFFCFLMIRNNLFYYFLHALDQCFTGTRLRPLGDMEMLHVRCSRAQEFECVAVFLMRKDVFKVQWRF